MTVTDSITRQIGASSTGTSNGSLPVSEFSDGRGWVALVANAIEYEPNASLPRVVVNTSGVTWDFDSSLPQLTKYPLDFIYGVY